jgi:periplasmic protein TonB
VDAETHVAYRPLGRGFAGGVLITIAIHGLIAALVYQSQRRSAARPEAVRDFIVTRTITFTKKREKFWLPKVVTPPKPTAPPPVIKLAQNPEAPPVPPPPKEAPKPQDREISKDLKRALERARSLAAAVKEEEPEGSELGIGDGNSTQAVAGDEYFTQVYNAIRQNWSTPTGLINDAQLAGLSAEVRIQIDSDGSLRNASLNRSSGNNMFDESCMRAVRSTGSVPAPPANLRARVRRGVALDFAGKDM